MTQPIWRPSADDISSSNMFRFMVDMGSKYGVSTDDYFALHKWSVTDPNFWREIAENCGAIGDFHGDIYHGETIENATWFPEGAVNYAETVLQRRDNDDAIVFWGEDKVKRRFSANEFYDLVSQIQAFLKAEGVTKGDRVAGFMPNLPETIAAMLAASSLGAIWSSCSPDFGKQGVLDRFGQIEPKIVFAVDGYYYNGKVFNTLDKVADFSRELPSVQKTVVFRYVHAADTHDIANGVWFDDAVLSQAKGEVEFVRVAFDHPLFILYSSGTTGAPKAIVHGHGGTILQHLKEHQLHSNIKEGDRVFYFTTCSWMMWNWLVSALASKAAVMLYDGSPFAPNGNILWDYAEAEKFTFFGTSAKYIEALAKHNIAPVNTHDLSQLRTMASTGSPLVEESYDYVYRDVKADIHLASISGGTDIVSCFILGVPVLPVYRGEIQAPGLGMDVQVWNDEGAPVHDEQGDLVCVAPFPSRPVQFWNDPKGEKFHDAYFDAFEGVWTHGDFAKITKHGGVIIFGRSDAVLNPGGVRIGTAEIYRQVEKVDEVLESIVIGQRWNNDVRVILFVRLREGVTLDEDIVNRIRHEIKANATPRHLPSKIIQVSDIPRTKSGKIVEIPVRDIVHGRKVKNIEALANPEALALFENLAELQA